MKRFSVGDRVRRNPRYGAFFAAHRHLEDVGEVVATDRELSRVQWPDGKRQKYANENLALVDAGPIPEDLASVATSG